MPAATARRLLLLLTALTALLLATASSALAAASAQNGVRAFTEAGQPAIGLKAAETPCSRPGSALPRSQIASGFCVATVDIGDLRAGERVLAGAQSTGATESRPVTAVWIHRDDDLLDVLVQSGHRRAEIKTTRRHLFYDESTRSWVEARRLHAGALLRTANGRRATVVSEVAVHGGRFMWDLTVARDHDFFLAVAGSSVLVHNCPTGDTGDEASAFPEIKSGSSGGPTAGKPFPQSIRQQALEENPSTCVFCHMDTDSPQVDHAIPRANGGNATLDNAQTACPFCNASKGARQFPVNPPPGYEGPFPPPRWDPGGGG